MGPVCSLFSPTLCIISLELYLPLSNELKHCSPINLFKVFCHLVSAHISLQVNFFPLINLLCRYCACVLKCMSFRYPVSLLESKLSIYEYSKVSQTFINTCQFIRIFVGKFLLVSFCRYFRESTYLDIFFKLHIFNCFFVLSC